MDALPKLKLDVRVEEIPVAAEPPSHKDSHWRERIHNFTWQWHVIVMATGACSSLFHNFPYDNGCLPLKITSLVFFGLDLVIFLVLFAWTVTRCIMFPEDWSKLFMDPTKSLFLGFFANGVAALLNAGLSVHNDWGPNNNALLYTLWGFWWLDCALSCTVAFGLVYVMMGQNSRDMSKIGPVWMVPIITMITMSTSGSLFTRALLPTSHTHALLSLAISATLLLIGLSFTMMFTAAFLLRLYLYGPLDAHMVLTTFTTLTPLGQGGYSLLMNGKDLADLLPEGIRADVSQGPLVGNIIYTICFCGAYALWSMGLAWIAIACFSILRRAATLPAFCVSHWCIIVPNGVFAALSVQMSTVLDSPFFKVFGAVWSCIVVLLWVAIFLRTIPALIDGSIFKPANAAKSNNPPEPAKMPTPLPLLDEEKGIVTVRCLEVLQKHDHSVESIADTLCSVDSIPRT